MRREKGDWFSGWESHMVRCAVSQVGTNAFKFSFLEEGFRYSNTSASSNANIIFSTVLVLKSSDCFILISLIYE